MWVIVEHEKRGPNEVMVVPAPPVVRKTYKNICWIIVCTVAKMLVYRSGDFFVPDFNTLFF